MPKYRVNAAALIGMETIVEADSEDEAIDLACERKIPRLGINAWAKNGDRDPDFWNADDTLNFDTDDISAEVINE